MRDSGLRWTLCRQVKFPWGCSSLSATQTPAGHTCHPLPSHLHPRRGQSWRCSSPWTLSPEPTGGASGGFPMRSCHDLVIVIFFLSFNLPPPTSPALSTPPYWPPSASSGPGTVRDTRVAICRPRNPSGLLSSMCFPTSLAACSQTHLWSVSSPFHLPCQEAICSCGSPPHASKSTAVDVLTSGAVTSALAR